MLTKTWGTLGRSRPSAAAASRFGLVRAGEVVLKALVVKQVS